MSLLFICVVVAFLVDQSSKLTVEKRLGEPVFCGPLLKIRKVHHHERRYQRTVFRRVVSLIWCFAFVSAVGLQVSGLWLRDPVAVLGVGCALGGAAGNLADILRRRHIVDFIDLGWWPVFNFADVVIVGGLALGFWH